MCTVNDITRKKKARGYKAVVKKNGKYYSPFTGLEYKVGMKIPKMKKERKNADSRWGNILSTSFYTNDMQGKTGVFKSKSDCKQFITYKPYIILEMILGGDIYDGKFSQYKTYIGSEILNIKELKD